jgi:hypothetical protein
VPVGIFHLTGQQPFASTRRTNAVYFDYPWESYEQAKIALPTGFQIESLPATTRVERGPTVYESSATKQGNIVQLNRTLKMAAYYVPVEKYAALKQFYELIRAGDEQQAVLKASPVSDKH